MKAVILAGGLGTRLAEETVHAEADGRDRRQADALAHHEHLRGDGFNEFIVALGYRGEVIKRYFLNFYALNNDLTLDRRRQSSVHDDRSRALADRTRGHGPQTKTAAASGASPTGSATTPSCSPTATASPTSTYRSSSISISRTASSRPSRRSGRRRASAASSSTATRARVHREAADRRGLDQRRLLRPRARHPRLHRRRRHDLGARAAGAARRATGS